MPPERSLTGLPLAPEQTAPATPPAGFVAIFAKVDRLLYALDSTGAEDLLSESPTELIYMLNNFG